MMCENNCFYSEDNTLYTQCLLIHKVTKQIDLAWIPDCYAVIGKILIIKGENGWRVEEIHGSKTLDQLESVDRFNKSQIAQSRRCDIRKKATSEYWE
jgi:hypothetical protein